MRLLVPLSTLVMLLAACGDDDEMPDGGVGDADVDAGSVVMQPNIPWLDDGAPPVGITPCPDGWHEVTDDRIATCDPYPEAGALDCPAGEAHFPGEAGCVPVGSACPTGEFAEGLPADRRVVYVQPGATGGDGSSPSQPHGSLTRFSISGLPIGAVIALSRGRHAGPVRLVRGIVLWGACAAETVVTASEPHTSVGVITLRDAGGEVRDLTVADGPRPGVTAFAEGTEGVLSGLVVRSSEGSGVLAFNGAHLVGHTIAVRDIRGRSSGGGFGRGIDVESGGRLELTRALIEGNRDYAIYVDGADSIARLTDVVARETQGMASDGTFGRGLNIQSGATMDLTRVLVEQNREAGLFARGPGSVVTGVDVVVRDTRGQARDGTGGRGLNVEGGAVLEMTRTVLSRNRNLGLFALGEGTAVTLADVVVRDTEGEASDGSFGRGLNVQLGATLQVTRALIERNRDIGLYATDSGSAMSLADVVVRETDGQTSDGTGGRGLNVQLGASLEATRALLERNRDSGVFADGTGTTAMLADLVVRDTQSRTSDGTRGRGLSVQRDARLELSRGLLERNRDLGVHAGGAGATVALTDIIVRDALPQACVETTCPDSPAGHGVGAYVEASVSMSAFVVAGAETCGLHLALGGRMDLSDGRVSDSPIGVCVQVDGYDLGRLMSDVSYMSNGVNLQTTSLPVPELAADVPSAP